jgi:hypothetical protein
VGASVGTVLALQAAYSLKTFGAIMYTGSLVCVAMARELGPLIASIVISGRIGARMAAEIGTMMVQEEVDALTTMGINPIRYLVTPRVLALALMLPCLAVIVRSHCWLRQACYVYIHMYRSKKVVERGRRKFALNCITALDCPHSNKLLSRGPTILLSVSNSSKHQRIH